MLFSKRELVKIAIPLILQQILAVTVGMVDTMMVSSAGEAAVSGVSLVNTVDIMLVMIFSALVSGGSVVVSQALGSKDISVARSAAKQLTYSSTFVALALAILVVTLRIPLLHLLYPHVEADVMYSAQSYMFYVALSFPFLALSSSCASLFRVMGNSAICLVTSICTNLVNVAGNAILIFHFKMGAAGAAIATLIARMLGSVIELVLIQNKKHPIYIEDVLHYRPDFKIIKAILRIGVPNGIENGMFQFGKLLTQSLISSFGTAATAANAVGNTLAQFQYMPGAAIGSLMITVVGRCIGAREKKQATYYARLLTGATYACLWVVVLGTILFSRQIIGIYNLSPESGDLAHQMIIYHAVCAAVLWPSAFTLPTSLRAASDVRFTLKVSMFSMWAFRVALSYVFCLESISLLGITIPALGLGPIGVWVAMTVDWVFRAALFIIRHFSGKWLNKYRALTDEKA